MESIKDNSGLFIIPNIGNSCYIDSILMGLFFNSSSNCDYLLKTDLGDVNGIYLQEIIKCNFVDRVREFKSVDRETMEQIRFFCNELGWKKENSEEILRQQDVSEFYMFLLEKLNGKQIKIQNETITEGIKSSDDIGNETDIPYIPLSLPLYPHDNIKSIKVRDMLDKWLYDNTKEVKRFVITENVKTEKMVKALDIKNIMNIPQIMALGINRFQNVADKEGNFKIVRNNIDIFIQKKISPFKNQNELNRREWIFQAAICHKGDTLENGHYYCLIRDDSKDNDYYYLFNDLTIPSLVQVSMSDKTVTDQIKKDCVFLIYHYLN